MTTDLQALIDAEAARIHAFNDHEQPWQDCPHEPVHHRGRYCEHQVTELANHLARNRVQREDAEKQALVRALEDAEDWIVAIESAKFPRNLDTLKNIRAALKGKL